MAAVVDVPAGRHQHRWREVSSGSGFNGFLVQCAHAFAFEHAHIIVSPNSVTDATVPDLTALSPQMRQRILPSTTTGWGPLVPGPPSPPSPPPGPGPPPGPDILSPADRFICNKYLY